MSFELERTVGNDRLNRMSLFKKVLSYHNWRGLKGLILNSVDPIEMLARYYWKKGSYPFIARLRTPIGEIELELYSRDDLVTVHEIFFRQDYYVAGMQATRLRTAVDFGANIGVASAYFLTRNTEAKVYSYEPVPANVARTRKNLAFFSARVELNECAVGNHDGIVGFGVEPTGRYGGIGLSHVTQIEVPCRHGERELKRILQQNERIDMLKLDIEDMEIPVIKSLAPQTLGAIGCIVAECDGNEVSLPGFAYEQYLSVARFTASDPLRPHH